MPAGNELGITWNVPYGGYAWFLSNAQYTEIEKFLYIADEFPRIRIIVDYGDNSAGGHIYPNNGSETCRIWAEALKAYKPSCYILYGSTNNLTSNTLPELSYFLPSAYETYKTFLLAVAEEANNIGADLFCVGNENLISASHTQGMVPTSITRSSNVATATFSYNHGLTTGDYIFVSSGSDASYRVADTESGETVQCTVVSSTVITYPSTGTDGTATGSYKVGWSAYEVVRKVKALAVDVRAVLGAGIDICYSESQGHTTPWINIGITPGTDLDFVGLNGYGSGSDTEANFLYWKNEVDGMCAAFGSSFIITEFNVVQDSGNQVIRNYYHEQKAAETVFDRELKRRYEYALSLGITQIYLFGANEYPFFANTYPGDDYNTRYKVGRLKPVIEKLKGQRMKHVLLGVNTDTT